MAIPAGAERVFTRQIRFAKPGYYHIMALVATVHDEEKRADRDERVPVPPAITTSAWILVEENGGRFDSEYDESVRNDDRRYLSSGTVGTFRPRPAKSERQAVANGVYPAASLATSPTAFHGRVTYQFYNPAIAFFETRGVPGAKVEATCVRDDNEVVGYSVLTTNLLGEFTATCPEDQTFHVSISAGFVTSAVSVRGQANQSAAGGGAFWVDEYGGERLDFPVINSEAAQVFINFNRYNAGVPALFGRTRGVVTYRVSNTTTGPAVYEPSGDFIRMYTNSTWGRPGISTAVHEYGHAFHYVAVDPWSSNSCPSNHAPGTPTSTSCAYIEVSCFS